MESSGENSEELANEARALDFTAVLKQDEIKQELEGDASDNDDMQEELKNEEEIRKNVFALENVQDEKQLEKILTSVKKVTDKILVPSFQDITSMFSNGQSFLVDGDSLILNVMGNENYNSSNGGQLLHFIYLCERHLQLFSRKGGCFEVVFFKIWSQAWADKPTLLLARTVLMCHLKYNMSCIVHEFDSVCDRKFEELLKKHKCGFLLIDYEMIDMLETLFSEDHLLEDLIFHIQVCYCLVTLSLGCVDINDVELNVSTLNAFYTAPDVVVPSSKLKKTLDKYIQYIKHCSNKQSLDKESKKRPAIPVVADKDVRHMVTVGAAVLYLTDTAVSKSREEWIKAFLLYSAFVEVLPLKFRGCPKSTIKPTYEFIKFVTKLHQHMNYILQGILNQNEKYNFQYVSDLWHGNFFALVMDYLSRHENDLNSSMVLGEETRSMYEELLQEVSRFSNVSLKNFPQVKQLSLFKKKKINQKTSVRKKKKSNFWPAQLIPTSCVLTTTFCKDIMPQQLKVYDDKILQGFITKNLNFEERKHWHSKKTITDIYDHVRDDSVNVPIINTRFANYMAIYGSSIEGRPLSTKPIVSTDVNAAKKKLKKKEPKVSNSAKKMIQAIQKEADLKKEELDNKILHDFELKYHMYKGNGEYKLALTEVNFLVQNLKTEKHLLSGLIKKARILWHLWVQECTQMRNRSDRNVTYTKELFLVVQEILKKSQHYELSEKNSKLMGKYLYQMGLEKIAQMWNLPKPKHMEDSFSIGKSWVELQLVELGPELERVVGIGPDSRVEGFIPDNWQRELFDCVDRKQSVLVVAPTSSGKTYASYYCMERVLKEDNDGIVVYVAPTKALVNQVAATVYARFKNKEMPVGKSVYGIFTRDYRKNAMNCQILITVPQCLELLLLSPRRYDWVKHFRYIIFDEIHCIAGQAGGFSWESGLLLIQCPFLALSATIEQPEDLHKWLQHMQDFKKTRDIMDGHVKPCESYEVKLVVYRDRHADLKKHVYENNEIVHIHPYAYLDNKQVSKGGGIPSAVSLLPEEVYQLYKAMDSVSSNNPELQELEPDGFFSSCCLNGFISRNAVREYEAKLKKVLQDWASDNPEHFDTVVMQLRAVSSSVVSGSGHGYIAYNFIHFIRRMQNENMLPALIFSYNRQLVNSLFVRATEHYERCVESCKEKQNVKIIKQQCSPKNTKEPKKFSNSEVDFKVSRGVHGKNKFEKTLGLMDSENIRHYYGVTVKQVGHANHKVVEYVEQRLMYKGFTQKDILPRGLKMGIGKHFGGMSAVERSAVEMLFRMKMLNIVIATGTLALGIHMPCKTVAIVGDSHFLNTLEFQQMSGRAGRRGFDTAGNVIFMGLNERKMKSLLLGNLPKLVGNFPLSVTMVLRLLLLVSNITSQGLVSEEAKHTALSRVLTLLNCCLVYETISELKAQMKHFFAFSVQLLMLQGLLDNEGNPQFLSGIVTHLSYHEPGNLAFVFLMKSGALRKLCQTTKGKVSVETQMNLLIVLSYLFAPLRLHKNAVKKKYDNSKVILPPLPSYIRKVLEEYNEQVLYIFNNYFKSVADHCFKSMGEDETLPLSKTKFKPKKHVDLQRADSDVKTLEKYILDNCETRAICSSFAALSGHTDEQLYSHRTSSNIRHDVFTDVKIVPLVELDVDYNGYAWDFYNHGISVAIQRDNNLKQGEDFTKLYDFMLVLKCIQTSLSELTPQNKNDNIVKTFDVVTEEFTHKFKKAYNMKM